MSPSTVTERDLALLSSLAAAAGIAPERVGAISRRIALGGEARQGAPYVLLLGAPDAVRAIVAAAAGPQAGEKLRELRSPVAVMGRQPDAIRPLAATWPQIAAPGLAHAGLIVLPSGGPLAAATIAALASLGTIELGVLASRISQPLNQAERALAAALAGIVETMRVAFVVQRGEELSETDAAELHAYGKATLEASGYGGGRFRECRLLLPGTASALVGASTPAQILDPGAGDNAPARAAAIAVSVAALAREIEANLRERPQAAGIAATPEDLAKLSGQLEQQLAGLGEGLAKLVAAGDIRDDAAARTYLLDKVDGWLTGQGLAANTMTLADKFRPGIKGAMASAAREAAASLSIIPAPRARRPAGAESTAIMKFLARTHWARAVAAISVGVISGMLTSILLPILPAEQWLARLAAPALGGLIGLALYIVLGQPWLIGMGPRPHGTPAERPANPVRGWPVVSERLLASFRGHLADDGGRAQLAALAELTTRLGHAARSTP